MKYPVNHTFTVSTNNRRQSPVITPQVQLHPRNTINSLFSPGASVEINFIRIQRGSNNIPRLVYIFRDVNTNELIEKEFPSTAAADAYIDKLSA